jgi:hypothetical protein
MNLESKSITQGAQAGKSTSYKRAHRASRKPILLTEQNGSSAQAIEEAARPAVPVAVEERLLTTAEPARKRGPKFFANVEKIEKTQGQPSADPIAARLARALRGRGASSAQESASEKKTGNNVVKPGAKPAPKSGFKSRYIFGMVAYLLIADVAGVYITNFMNANHINAFVFTAGPITADRSTLVFLALLVIILVLFARFDLIPRSLSGAMNGGSSARGAASSKKKDEPTFETREAQPTIKQGVQGNHDDLYREYRENQRYFQKRDRKK